MNKCDYFDTCDKNTGSVFCDSCYKSCEIYKQNKEMESGETALGIGAVQPEDIQVTKAGLDKMFKEDMRDF